MTPGNLGLHLWPWSKDTNLLTVPVGVQVLHGRLPTGFLSRPHSASKPVSSVGQPDFIRPAVAFGR